MTESIVENRQPRLDMLAVTISPPPNNDVKKQCDKWKKRLSKLQSNFAFYPEIAYNNKTNNLRLHFHGWIECLDMVKFQKDIDYLKGFCFIDIKPIFSYTNWLKYCKKELIKTKITLGLKKNSNILLTKSNCIVETESKSILDYFINKSDLKNVE